MVSTLSGVSASEKIDQIPDILDRHKQFFATGITKDVNFRIDQLKRLKEVIMEHETDIYDALKKDLNKSPFTSFMTEIAMVLGEIDLFISKLKKWSKPKKVRTGMVNFKANSKVYYDPYGTVLVIAPWNYPFQLTMSPLAGAIAAGNCVVVKPSEIAPATSAVMTKIIQENFVEDYISVFEGGVPVSQALLEQRFDYIFYTGSTHVGRIVYQAAAKHLTPVTLELGGKSPCIVDEDIQLNFTAKRIIWGKLLNAGQTCVAPDYILVNRKVKDALLKRMTEVIEEFYGTDPSLSDEYCKIINERHFMRLSAYIDGADIAYGGDRDMDRLYIGPTILDNVKGDDPVMQDEIFGPILPILTYDHIEEAISFVNEREKPLALYVFSKDKQIAKKVLKETSSGGACVNDTIMHLASEDLPFGGVGASGIGAYHGKHSFTTFSHQKAVLNKSTRIDVPLRYVPYKVSLAAFKQMAKFIR